MFSFSLIERVILSAGAMLIFSAVMVVSTGNRTQDLSDLTYYRFKLTKCPKAKGGSAILDYIRSWLGFLPNQKRDVGQ